MHQYVKGNNTWENKGLWMFTTCNKCGNINTSGILLLSSHVELNNIRKAINETIKYFNE